MRKSKVNCKAVLWGKGEIEGNKKIRAKLVKKVLPKLRVRKILRTNDTNESVLRRHCVVRLLIQVASFMCK